MKLLFIALGCTLVVTAHVARAEDKGLTLRSKAAIASVAPHRSAPYVMPLGEVEPSPLFTHERDPRQASSHSSCESDRSLCYDPVGGRIVYKPARALMPDVPGLRAENISVKRDKIVLRYSF